MLYKEFKLMGIINNFYFKYFICLFIYAYVTYNISTKIIKLN